MLAGTVRPLDQREGQLTVEVVEFGRDLSARVLGEPMQRQRDHCLGPQGRDTQQRGNRFDGRRPVVGVHDCIKHFMSAVQRGDQRIGDLPARGRAVKVSHDVEHRR